jgi:hypothetical protein
LDSLCVQYDASSTSSHPQNRQLVREPIMAPARICRAIAALTISAG